jgi:hypothetical protein
MTESTWVAVSAARVRELSVNDLGPHKEEDHHHAFDHEERQRLCRVCRCPRGHRDEREYAGGPEHGPGDLVFFLGTNPGVLERRDGSDEGNRQAGSESQDGAVEIRPEDDRENCSCEAPQIELRPAGLAVLQGECRNQRCSHHRSDDLPVYGVLGNHTREGDAVQGSPDDPGGLLRLRLTPQNCSDVGHERHEEHKARENGESLQGYPLGSEDWWSRNHIGMRRGTVTQILDVVQSQGYFYQALMKATVT